MEAVAAGRVSQYVFSKFVLKILCIPNISGVGTICNIISPGKEEHPARVIKIEKVRNTNAHTTIARGMLFLGSIAYSESKVNIVNQ